MTTKGKGQYDQEYANCPCFWGTDPSKFVLLLHKHLKTGKILDIGAGEGKNSIYFAEHGFRVTAVECSLPAIKNFENRLGGLHPDIRSRICIVQTDVLEYVPTESFDAVVAYGLLHCLPNLDSIMKVANVMKEATINEGFNVIATFTDSLPVPDIQSYLEPTLVPEKYILTMYSDWSIMAYEEGVIKETHPTSNIPHKHSIARLLARKK